MIYRLLKRILAERFGENHTLVKTKCQDLCKKGPVVIWNNSIMTGFKDEDVNTEI